MLKVSEITKHCFYASSYTRGQEIFYNKKYRKFSIDYGDGEEPVLVTAEVKGSGSVWYESSLTISESEDEIEDYSCDCLSYQQTECLCKHCVALALAFQQEQKNQLSPANLFFHPITIENGQMLPERRKSTSNSVTTLIRNCYSREENELAAEEMQKIHIQPSFRTSYHGKLSVECTLGSSRMYIVKDLLCLLAAVEQRAQVSYGKNLTFVHQPSAFTPEGRRWLEIFRSIVVVEKNIHDLSSRPYEPSGNSPNRSLDLDAYGTELCLSYYRDAGLPVDGMGQTVIDGNPSLTLTLSGEQGGASLKLNDGFIQILPGYQHTYLLVNRCIYQCTQDYIKAVQPLLQAFGVTPGSGYYAADRSLFLAEGDYRSFCAHVLPLVEPYVKVFANEVPLQDYRPEPAQFKIYLSMPDEADTMSVEARCEVTYGDAIFDLMDTGSDYLSYRDVAAEGKIKGLLQRYLPDAPQQFLCQGEEHVLNLVQEGIPFLQDAAELMIDEKILKIQLRKPPQISFGISLSGGLLTLNLQCDLQNPDEIADALQAYRQKKKYHRLKSGELISLDDDSLNLLQEVSDGLMLTASQLKKGMAILPKYRAAYLDDMAGKISGTAQIRRDAAFRRMIADLHSYQNSEYEVPEVVHATLRNYQMDGFRWLATLAGYGFGGILADDMGLGKTVQAIALFAQMKGKALVVAPASLVYNWESEIQKFAPSLTVAAVTGTAEQRKEILEKASTVEVVVTSYDLLKRDVPLYENLKFDCMVIDEAQYIKNPGTQAAKAVKAIQAGVRFALTGTPIENRLSDLWSIFDFIMPGYLYAYQRFRDEMEKPIAAGGDDWVIARLKAMISPFILRRRKEDVLKDLPERLEQAVYAPMSQSQEKLYRAMESKLAMELSETAETDFREKRIRILAELTRMRQVCCTPELCYENYHGGSGKVELCLELLKNAVTSGHRVLVFSQFTSMLEHLMAEYGQECLYLSGKNTKEQRRSMVDRFQRGEVPVFFISLKAGGTGLNLTAADTIIHVDPWWNVAAQNQASDRAHRIGQTKVVTVFKLVTRNTIEERILALQESKAQLAESILDGEGGLETSLTRETILNILGAKQKQE